jgi:hypothetical protein
MEPSAVLGPIRQAHVLLDVLADRKLHKDSLHRWCQYQPGELRNEIKTANDSPHVSVW